MPFLILLKSVKFLLYFCLKLLTLLIQGSRSYDFLMIGHFSLSTDFIAITYFILCKNCMHLVSICASICSQKQMSFVKTDEGVLWEEAVKILRY